MKNNVVNFRLRDRAGRDQAMNWLYANNVSFPYSADYKIGPNEFHGWRFIMVNDKVYFADCIHAGISEHDLEIFTQQVNININGLR